MDGGRGSIYSAFNLCLWILALPTGCYGTLSDPAAGFGGSAGEPTDPAPTVRVEGCGNVDFGRSALRRLNAREYRHTVDDLLGVRPDNLALPHDGLSADGFDTNGKTLTLREGDAQLYFDAADIIASAALQEGTPPFDSCRSLVGAELHTCVRPGLADWLVAAFRRPVGPETLDRVQRLVSSDTTYPEVVTTVLTYTLVSPHFLFHHQLSTPDGFELANRLSYFLWSSGPDDELRSVAQDGSLSDPDVFAAQASRLIADPRSERFLREFTGLWLSLDRLLARADSEETRELFESMKRESETFVYEALAEDRPLHEILSADYSYVNSALSTLYGMDEAGLELDSFDRLSLPAERRGLLTHASLLAANSPTGVSDPIRRGAWIAEKVMCAAPPPPPPDVPELPTPDEGGTIRDALEQHRADPACAGCHSLIDPYGLALEVFDGTGAFRDVYDNGTPVDTSGELITGESFDDAVGLTEIVETSGAFEECFSENIAAYALGRGLSAGEVCVVEQALRRRFDAGEDVRLSHAIVDIVLSPLFSPVAPAPVTEGVER